jgi:hypothetical protein
VCEFANHRGGLLLVGVDEKDGTATGVKATVVDPESLERRLRVALANYAAPTPLIDIVAIPSSGTGNYLAVIIPPSGQAPHAVTDGPGSSRRTLYFPVRDGSDTRWMPENEVADRYRIRVLARSHREASLMGAVAAGADQLGLASGLWLCVASNPESPAGMRLDQAGVDEIKKWRDTYALERAPIGQAWRGGRVSQR